MTKQEAANKFRANAGVVPLIGESDPWIKALRMAYMSAKTESRIMLIGEPGTGKSTLAEAIHLNSRHKDKEMVEVQCGSIHPDCSINELFGHRKGSYTDAEEDRVGIFAGAHEHTLCLYDITDMSPGFQAAIVGVVKNGAYRPLGNTKPRTSRPRIISSSDGAIEEAVKNGAFSKKLLFLLSEVTIKLPPLRDRKEDVLLIAQHRLDIEMRNFFAGQVKTSFSKQAKDKLMLYQWPGNVRELKSAIRMAAYFAHEDDVKRVHVEHLHEMDAWISLSIQDQKDELAELIAAIGKKEVELGETEAMSARNLMDYIFATVIDACGGNKKQAAKILGGMHPGTLLDGLRRIGLYPPKK